jgi:hypothetical protein
MLPRFSALRNNRLSDLQIETREHIFWSDPQSPDV